MSVTVETGSTLTFEKFWRWVKRHPHCILRAGTADAFLYDQDDLHWRLDEDAARVPTVQLFVQVTPDPEGEAGQFLFEVIGGDAEPYPVYHFLLAHGFEEEGSGHRQNVLKQ